MANTSTRYEGSNRLVIDEESECCKVIKVTSAYGTRRTVLIPAGWDIVSEGKFKDGDCFLTETDECMRSDIFVKVNQRDLGYPVSKYKLVIRKSTVHKTTHHRILQLADMANTMPSVSPYDLMRWTW
jgi:hypothetical protein